MLDSAKMETVLKEIGFSRDKADKRISGNGLLEPQMTRTPSEGLKTYLKHHSNHVFRD